jgi:hypothetical protein
VPCLVLQFHCHTETTAQESSTNTVELPDDDPDTVSRFLQFLYTGTYHDEQYPNWSTPDIVSTMDVDEVHAELGEAPGVAMMSDADSADTTYVPELEEPREPPEEYAESSVDSRAASETSGTGSSQPDLSAQSNLITSVHVYALADKYDVPALKLLARRRFYSRARQSFMTDMDFPATVDELYQITTENDYAMREIACRVVASGYSQGWEGVVKMEPIMRKHGDFSLGVMKYYTMYMVDRDFNAPALVFRAAALASAES